MARRLSILGVWSAIRMFGPKGPGDRARDLECSGSQVIHPESRAGSFCPHSALLESGTSDRAFL